MSGGTGGRARRAVRADMAGQLSALDVAVGDRVRPNQQLGALEVMKMEQVVLAPCGGVVAALLARPGDVGEEGQAILEIEPGEGGEAPAPGPAAPDPDRVRDDLRTVLERHAFTRDEARPEAVARRTARGRRTARRNVADLCDPGSFQEYGALAIAAQRRRRPLAELVRDTPADGLVAGIGTVNAAAFGPERARCLVLAYDYTVLAGTQGATNHKKTDRMLGLAERFHLPVVLFAEGGGGRPGDTDALWASALDVPTFASYARLSGLVPRVGVVAGHCFAGNAALLGSSDLIVATRDSSIGMGGPAMIEGGGLGTFRPEEVGPTAVQAANGVVDVVVEDEAAAVAAARRLLGFFQGTLPEWRAPDPRPLREVVPENRLRPYDVRAAWAGLFDEGSVLELRPGFGGAVATALARLEGRPVGVMASDPRQLAGAIDPDAADKASRFMQLCDAFGLPILSLCDTPGFLVGPEVEARAHVRHASRMFVTAASLSVPLIAVVLRKGFGLGAQALTGGGFHAPLLTVAWPTGEFGAMGIEGAVRLGYRKELAAIADEAAREARFREMVRAERERGSALNVASHAEIDAVIDPAETRAWVLRALRSAPPAAPGRRRTFLDTW